MQTEGSQKKGSHKSIEMQDIEVRADCTEIGKYHITISCKVVIVGIVERIYQLKFDKRAKNDKIGRILIILVFEQTYLYTHHLLFFGFFTDFFYL